MSLKSDKFNNKYAKIVTIIIAILLILFMLLLILQLCLNSKSLESKVVFDAQGGVEIENIFIEDSYNIEKETTKAGYNFEGWYYTADCKGERVYSVSPTGKDITLYAKWSSKDEVILSFNSNGGSEITAITKLGGEVIEKPADPIRECHDFIGWYCDNGTFDIPFVFDIMPATSITIHAKWERNTFTVTFLDYDGSFLGVDFVRSGMAAVAPVIPEREPDLEFTYTFIGWNTPHNNITEDIMVKAIYAIQANSYTVSFDGNGGEYVSGDLEQIIEYGSDAIAPIFTKTGYSLGWDKALNNITGNTTITAQWSINQYTINFNSNGGSAVTTINQDYASAVVSPPKPTKEYYYFTKWYTDDNTFTNEYTFATMPAENITLHAKWTLLYQRIDFEGVPATNGNYILFGEYPQTIASENAVQSMGTLADEDGYYVSAYDNERYAKVTATPFATGYTFSSNAEVINGTDYYFKVEPIKWRILSETNGEAFILCESIIANKAYYSNTTNRTIEGQTIYPNNYKHSDIRAFLNNEFYGTAFNDLQQELIAITEVNNGVSSTGYGSNNYVCENTFDKIFLPCRVDIGTSAYGFTTNATRQRITSDYSRATGSYMSITEALYGKNSWWLRTPYTSATYAHAITSAGEPNGYYGVSLERYGVVPALKITLSATVNFNTDGADAIDPVVLDGGQRLAAPTTPEKDGFVFDGWYLDAIFDKRYDFNALVTSTFTLYAKWLST